MLQKTEEAINNGKSRETLTTRRRISQNKKQITTSKMDLSIETGVNPGAGE